MPRPLLLLGLSALLLLTAPPQSAAADQTFENRELGISFVYPDGWSIASGQGRGVLPNQTFDVRVALDGATAFAVTAYRLDTPITADNFTETFARLDGRVGAWIVGLPGGRLIEKDGLTVDEVDGGYYHFEYLLDGQPLEAEMLIIPQGDRAIEITQWGRQAEYEARAELFDVIFDSLVLPWTPSLNN